MILTLSINTSNRSEMIDITSKVEKELKRSGLKDGVCFLFVPHTTAGITINESADPSVATDIQECLINLSPGKDLTGIWKETLLLILKVV